MSRDMQCDPKVSSLGPAVAGARAAGRGAAAAAADSAAARELP